jgi:hypothetical protein
VYAKKNMNENEIATAINAGAVDGGADSIPLAELPGIAEVSINTE